MACDVGKMDVGLEHVASRANGRGYSTFRTVSVTVPIYGTKYRVNASSKCFN